MSDQIPEGGGGNPAPVNQPPVNTPPVNQPPAQRPPYADHLEKFPEGLRSLAEPVLKEIDGATTQRFQELQGRLSEYEPYQEFFDSYEPEGIKNAIAFAEKLSSQEGALELFNQLGEALGFDLSEINGGEGEPQQQDGQQFDLSKDPAFAQMQKQMAQITEFFQAQQQTTEQTQLVAQLEKQFEELEQTHFKDNPLSDEESAAIIELATANGGDLAKAFDRFKTISNRAATKLNVPAPIVGGGGNNNMPSNQPDMANLDPAAKKQLAIQALRAANAST